MEGKPEQNPMAAAEKYFIAAVKDNLVREPMAGTRQQKYQKDLKVLIKSKNFAATVEKYEAGVYLLRYLDPEKHEAFAISLEDGLESLN